MPVRGSIRTEEAEKRKESILQKIKASNVKSEIPNETSVKSNVQEDSCQDEEKIRQICIKVYMVSRCLLKSQMLHCTDM